MSLGIKIVKGMRDILPIEIPAWYYLEAQLKSILIRYGYQEIRMPLLEQTALFKRPIGEVTDIVEKEMYTFIDKSGESLSLRPESTVQCVRAVLDAGLIHNQSQRLWYYGPMFRRERPQKGRYRQFFQCGVEVFGLAGPDIDIEQLAMLARLWRELGLADSVVLQLNSLGALSERAAYRQALIHYFKQCKLDPESTRRLETNPLRLLDSKHPEMQAVIQKAPSLLDFLGKDSRDHFEALLQGLNEIGIAYEVNPRLVRGIDYYTHTVYEWVTTALGAQGTVCAGGRYNELVSQMGGPPTPAIGFALGVERLLMLLIDGALIPVSPHLDAYLVTEGTPEKIIALLEKLRQAMPELRLLFNAGGGSFKSQFKRADKSGATFALILGEEELKTDRISIKSLRKDIPQETLSFSQAVIYLKQQLTLKKV